MRNYKNRSPACPILQDNAPAQKSSTEALFWSKCIVAAPYSQDLTARFAPLSEDKKNNNKQTNKQKKKLKKNK